MLHKLQDLSSTAIPSLPGVLVWSCPFLQEGAALLEALPSALALAQEGCAWNGILMFSQLLRIIFFKIAFLSG
jgi:hypothetical protein